MTSVSHHQEEARPKMSVSAGDNPLDFAITEFDDGFYQGYYHGDLPDGKGIIIYKNGDCYFGNLI